MVYLGHILVFGPISGSLEYTYSGGFEPEAWLTGILSGGLINDLLF